MVTEVSHFIPFQEPRDDIFWKSCLKKNVEVVLFFNVFLFCLFFPQTIFTSSASPSFLWCLITSSEWKDYIEKKKTISHSFVMIIILLIVRANGQYSDPSVHTFRAVQSWSSECKQQLSLITQRVVLIETTRMC